MLPFLLVLLGPSSSLSFDFGVGPAYQAVAALSKASGADLKAMGSVASETVFLHVKNRPLKEVMEALARATCAEWTQGQDGAFSLSRSTAQADAERRKEIEERVSQLEKWRKEYVSSLGIPFNTRYLLGIVKEKSQLEAAERDENTSQEQWERVWRRREALERYDPACRAMARCLRDIDLRSIAMLEPEAAIVFSSAPNTVQRPLSAGTMSALANLQREQLLWGAALRTKPKLDESDRFSTDETIRFFKEDADFGAHTEPWQRTEPFRRKPTFAFLRVESRGSGYEFDLTMIDAQGKKVLELDSVQMTLSRPDASEGEGGQPNAKLPKVVPAEATSALFARVKGDVSAIETLRPYYDDPVAHDFLGLGNREMLQALGRAKDKSIVACLSDTDGVVYEEGLDLAKLVSGVNSDRKMTESTHWIEIRPRSWTNHWRDRVDRRAMAACAATFRSKGKIDILTYVRMVQGKRPRQSVAFVEMIDPNYRLQWASFELPYQSAFSLLLASLSDTQLKRLKRGDTIPYADLTSAQRGFVARIVYGTRTNTDSEGGVPGGILGLDATFELPRGILDGAGLRAEFGTEHIAVFHNGRTDGLDEFFRANLSVEDPSPMFWSGPPPMLPVGGMKNATVEVRRRERIVLRCGRSAGYWEVGRFAEPLPAPNSKPELLSQSSSEFRAKIQKVADGLERMFGGGRDFDPDRPKQGP